MKKPSFRFKIVINKGEKTLALLSRDYYQHWINQHLKRGDIGSIEINLKKPTRSQSQLAYYWVIIGLLSEHTGFLNEELHDAIIRMKFGTKEIKLGNETIEVRKSISNSAMFSKGNMIELIEFSLLKCSELDIVVPTPESLGYVSNY